MNGDYVNMQTLKPIQIKNFFSKIKESGSCWLWTADKICGGYGRFSFNGRLVLAHRFSYEFFNEEIPKGLQIDHLCRNRGCVNPEHMEVVTNRENMMRGLSPSLTSKRQLSKTHCPQNHPYSGENLYLDPNGGRRCRICNRISRKNRIRSNNVKTG